MEEIVVQLSDAITWMYNIRDGKAIMDEQQFIIHKRELADFVEKIANNIRSLPA